MDATADKPSPVTPPINRRWWQFSLKTMFVWVTVVALLLGLIGTFWIAPARRQQAAVKRFVELGGNCYYSSYFADDSWVVNRLRNWLPPDYWDSVQFVRFDGCPITDDDLTMLSSLPKLETLVLDGTLVTDAGLEHLSGLTDLWRLDLNGTQVTGAGFVHLQGLKQLELLNLRKAQVTNAGLAHLSGLTQLRELNLNYTHVSDDGLVHLHRLTNLDLLLLDNTQVSGTGIPALRQALPNCKIMYSRAEY